MKWEQALWYGFMVPFFIGGGLFISLLGQNIIIISIGLVSIITGIFLIWLDKKYDLDSTTVEITIDGQKYIIKG